MPSAPKLAPASRRAACRRWRARAGAARRRPQVMNSANSPVSARRACVGASPRMTRSGRAVDRDPVAFLHGRARRREAARRNRRRSMPPAPHTHGLPMPRATTAACDVMPAGRRQDALRRVHAVDVVGRGLAAHQDQALLLAARGRRVRVEHGPSADRAGRGRETGGDDVELGPGVESRVQQLVERRRIDAHHRLVARDEPLAHHVHRDLHRRRGGPLGRCGSGAGTSRALLHRELEVLDVAIGASRAAR